MKAMLIEEEGRLNWTDVPDPVIETDRVIIGVRAAGINRADILQRQGKYPSPAGWPAWMGLEVAGEILEMGEEAAEYSSFRVGDRVCALLGGGGYAGKASVPWQLVMPMPRGLSFAEAAALPEAYATSYLNLFLEGHLEAGQTAFIPAGASGLASVAIPLAKAFGARVITSVRTADIAACITHLGADRILLSDSEDVAAALAEEEAQGTPVNVSMDCLSGETLGKSLPYMARGGYWVVISTLAGIETQVSLRPLLTKGLHLVGSMLRNRPTEMKARILRELVEKAWPLIEAGKITPSIDRVLPMERAEEAHALMLANQHVGKLVLTVE